MRRGYGCVFFLAMLFACMQTIGCGGGGTTRLAVTTTSLPNGNVGAPYSATLEATGGTSPYTWSQVSGGAMPGGVSLGSSGVFNGMPTTAGTFGPYVFNATDATGTVAASANMGITIKATSLSVTTTALPNGVVNGAYSVTLTAVGGAAPYTWTETSGGALPPGLANVTSGGVIAGTPTMAGTYGPYVFTVTDSAKATAASASLTITITSTVAASCAPLMNEAALTSATPYAFLVKGTDVNGNPIDIAGSFTPNGVGGITNATVDYNGLSNGPAQMQVNPAASSYAFSTSTLGCLYLAFSGPVTSPASVKFTFSLSGFDGTLYHTGRIIESDTISSGTKASGFIHLQTPNAFSLPSLQPNYAFGVDGWTAESTGFFRTALAGTFTNSSGTLSAGYADMNTSGTPSGELTGGSGTLNTTIDATTGRGTGTYTIPATAGNLSFNFAFYILNGTDFILLSTDSPITAGSAPLLSGRALASSATYAAGALNGYFILAAQGLVGGKGEGNFAEIGTLNAANTGVIPRTILYVNDATIPSNTPYTNGSYTVEAASGRVATTGITTTSPIMYLTAGSATDDEIVGFLIGTDTAATSGVVLFQSTNLPSYVISNISGAYASSTEEDLDGLNGTSVGAFTFTGGGQFTATQNTTGSVPNLPSSGAVSINSDGSGILNGGSFLLVTNGAVIFAIPASGDPLLYVFTSGTLP